MEWLNYHHLYYFWTVMREGSITAAGRRLHLVPATVSSQISRLEDSLGGRLFVRSGRGLEPTDLGRHVYRYADEIFSIGRELMASLDNMADSGRIPLRIGVEDVLPKMVVRMLLEPVSRLPEPVRLICVEDKKEELLARLSLHRLDAVLSDSPAGRDLRVKVYNHLLGECGVSFMAVAEMAAPLRQGFPASLHGAPMLLPMERTTLRGQLDQWFDSRAIVPEVIGEFSDSALLKAFALEGDGIFALPLILEEEFVKQYRVGVIGRTDEIRERFYAISVERVIRHPAVTVISENARRCFPVHSTGPGASGRRG